MAIVKVVSSKATIGTALNYICKEEKTERSLIECVNCSKDNPEGDMQMMKELHNKTGGRQYKHFVLSFPPNEEISEEQALEVAMKILKRYAENFQIVFAVHKDRDHLHVHAIVNSVGLDGKKFQMKSTDLEEIKQHCNEITKSMGLSVPVKGQTYEGEERDSISAYRKEVYQMLKKAEKEEAPSYVMDIAAKVYTASKKAKSKDDFIKQLEEQGIKTTWEDNRKYITFIDLERELHGESKCKIRNNKLEQYFAMDLGKESLLHGFEINAGQSNEQAAARATEQLNRAINGTSSGTDRQAASEFIGELNATERSAEEVARNSTAERANRNAEQERLRIEEEQRIKAAARRKAEDIKRHRSYSRESGPSL